MYKARTVFIIGAGASAEFDLPVGSKLMDQIKANSKFVFDYGSLKEGVRDIWDQIRSKLSDQEIESRLDAFAEIHRAIDSAGSIDEFINRNYDDPMIAEMGKIQILYSIAKAEAESNLKNKGQGDIAWQVLDRTWISTFTKGLFEGVRGDQVGQIGADITIICFNYDRCIEYYLANAIQRSFRNVSRDLALQIVDNMNIIHPYGTIGRLPNLRGEGRLLDFGPDYSRIDYLSATGGLTTWSESVKDLAMISEMREAIGQAETFVFMGFAFAKQNIDLMRVEEAVRDRDRGIVYGNVESRNVYATAYGYKQQAHRAIKRKIASLWTDNWSLEQDNAISIEGENVTCSEFMRVNWLNLVQ